MSNKNLIFKAEKHSFHLVNASALPFLSAVFVFLMLFTQVLYYHQIEVPFRIEILHLSISLLILTVMVWFVSIIIEAGAGFHTHKVRKGLRFGMLLFIISEIMFFFAFFWAFFHVSLSPAISIGLIWPPVGTQQLDPWGLPLVNTILLLSSGFTVTLAHFYILKNNYRDYCTYLFLTIMLGSIFLICQAYEYKYGVKFSWRENIYGSIFFITTGFHGLHVTIGTLFLLFCLTRQLFFRYLLPAFLSEEVSAAELTEKIVKYTATGEQHFGFEAAAWYWHFVDVVWLFLFITIYWWGTA